MEKDIACVDCVDGTASFHCKTCKKYFCKRCEQLHFKASATNLHDVVALFQEDDLMLKCRPPFCLHHPDFPLNCFCVVSKEPICAMCAFEPEHSIAHDCGKVTLQKEEARQRELLAPELLYVKKVQATLEDLEKSFKVQLDKDRKFISSCQNALSEGDADKEILSTQLTCLEKNVYLDIETLEVLMWTTKRFVDDFNSVKDLYGYGFITAIKNLHLTNLLEEIRSKEIGLPPLRKLETSTWLPGLKTKLRNLGVQMTIKPTRDHFFQINEQPILEFGSSGTRDGKFNECWAIAFLNPSGDFYVVDHGNHRIQVFDQQGNFLFKFGSLGNGNGQLGGPAGIAVDPIGDRVIISEHRNHRIQYFDLKGNFIGSFGSKGNQDGQFNLPTGIAVDDNNGDIYVADRNNHRVQVFDENMKFLRKFGKKGTKNGEMEFPWGIGILSNGQVVVSEYDGKRLSVFEKNGRFVKYIGNGELKNPAHLFVDGNDNILVADWDNNRIAVFSSEGDYISSFVGLYGPNGVAMNQEGKLFTCGEFARIRVF